MGFKVDGGDPLLPADFPDQTQGPGVKLEDGAAVDDLQIPEFPGYPAQNLPVQGIICRLVRTAVQMVVAEGHFR